MTSNENSGTNPKTAAAATKDSIDQLIADLRIFATGEYLRPEDREFWEPLFDVSVVDELETALRTAVANVDRAAVEAAGDVGKRNELAAAATSDCLAEISRIEHAQGGSIFDEELEQIVSILNKAASTIGVRDIELTVEDYFTVG